MVQEPCGWPVRRVTSKQVPPPARGRPHLAAVVAGDLAHQREAEANAPVPTLAQTRGTIEGLKDALPLRLRDAWPAVGDAEAGAHGGERHHRGLDGRARRITLGVVQEVA